jgi:HlyD family secretion protein
MMKRLTTKLPSIIGVILLGTLLLYGFWPKAVEVDLARVTRGSLEVTVNDDGETRIREKYVVSAPVAGKLLRVQLEPGNSVKQGVTELARIEPSDPALLDNRTQAEAEARLRASEAALHQVEATQLRAEEALELASHEYDRARELLPANTISRSDFDAAEHRQHIAQADVRSAAFAVKVAEFELEHARAAASRYDADKPDSATGAFRLVAPIDGLVLHVFQEDAAVVVPGTPLLELGDPQDLELEIDVLSSEAVRIAPGSKVYVDHWGGPKPLSAVVRIVEPSAFLKVSALGVEEKRVNVIADFTDPWSSRQTLGDGFRIEARIVTASTADDALKVPVGTLFREGDTWQAFCVVDGVAESRIVQIGATNGLEAEIVNGLSYGDVVVVHPTGKVRDGVHVTENQ